MDRGLPELPDWIEEKLSVQEDLEIQLHFYVEPFLETDRPWLSAGSVASEVGVSKNTVRDRLSDLKELEVLESASGANGEVYWIRDERSAWPIPPDVEVEPVEEPDGLMVSELLGRWDVTFALVAVAAALLTSFLISVPMGAIMGGYEVAYRDLVTLLLVLGFLLAFVAVAFALLSLGLYTRRRLNS